MPQESFSTNIPIKICMLASCCHLGAIGRFNVGSILSKLGFPEYWGFVQRHTHLGHQDNPIHHDSEQIAFPHFKRISQRKISPLSISVSPCALLYPLVILLSTIYYLFFLYLSYYSAQISLLFSQITIYLR